MAKRLKAECRNAERWEGIYERAGRACERCRRKVGPFRVLRVPRQDLVLLCVDCHLEVDSIRQWADEVGLLIHRRDVLPRPDPIPRGVWLL